jgi:hypothetical protein
MRQIASLAWKEWHEVRIFLWIAAGVFIGLPLIGGLEATLDSARFTFVAFPWIGMFGGVLAIFAAVGITCRDLGGRLEDFWRSRPVGVVGWMLIKFLVGLAVVQAACILPLLIEWKFDGDAIEVRVFTWYPFFWTALYGIGFLSGCLVRRTAQAAMLALAGMLLLYLLPVVLPPVEWLNIETVMEFPDFSAERVEFAAGMMGISIFALVISLAAVGLGWRIESGRKMMYGSISAAVLIVFATASYQLGTNMPVLQRIEYKPDEEMVLRMQGSHGYMITGREVNGWGVVDQVVRSVDVTPEGIQVGGVIFKEPPGNNGKFNYYWQWGSDTSAASVGHPEIAYVKDWDTYYRSGTYRYNVKLYVADIEQGTRRLVRRWESDDNGARVYIWRDRMYLMGEHIVTMDISRPLEPRVISETPFPEFERMNFWFSNKAETKTVPLPSMPGLPARQRLEALLKVNWQERMEGDVVVDGYLPYDGLRAYRLVKLTEDSARFEKIGEYRATLLERFFGGGGGGEMAMENGLLYTVQAAQFTKGNSHVTVFDASGKGPLREIGHFGAPGIEGVWPLEDGRAIVVGDEGYWLVGAPPAERNAE